ncbi:MAG TPA: hypothetical protein VFI43_04930 [Nitrosospira sp.]|nr:hypothetical protein [Nitrosospira sp.]
MKRLSIIAGFALGNFTCSVAVIAQNMEFSSLNAMQVLPPVDQHAFISGDEIHTKDRVMDSSAGLSSRPVIVLPVPLSQGRQLPADPYRFHYPGSYIPRDTPLHRFNGYIVCDPPDAAKKKGEARQGTNTGKPTDQLPEKAATPRLVKITSTRPLAAPDYLKSCPIYTINGQIQRDASVMASPSADGEDSRPAQRAGSIP